jgi:phasin family protein
MAQQSAKTVHRSWVTVADVIQEVSREWMNFTQTQVRHNLDRMNALTSCRTPQEFAAVQSELIRDNMEGMLQTARRTTEILVQMSDDAMKNMAKTVDQVRLAG